LVFAFAAVFAVACVEGDAEPGVADVAYVAEIEEWRAGRLERLKAENGYLNLAGLFWLEDIVSSFGSDEENDVRFPPIAAANMGVFELTNDGVLMTVHPEADVRLDGERVESLLMHDGTTAESETVTSGSLAWVAINRDGKIGIRLRDFKHPALEAFPPIPYFDINANLRVEATLKLFDAPKTMNVGTVIEGVGYNPMSPGVLVFAIDGESYELEAYASGENLFFVFGDQTSGRETYGAGRFVYTTWPDEGSKTVLDFNKSYNPPCAFGDFSTCPVASPQNRLPVRIEAGEKFVPELHVSSMTSH
jgi:uncharacterized protein (DUF1684 family)